VSQSRIKEILDGLYFDTRTQRGKGTSFERLVRQFLLTDPRYAERFDELVVDAAQNLARRWPSVDQIQFAVEEVPPSDPAPWERSVVLGRGFTAEPRAGLPARVVIYRRPVASRATNDAELADLVHRVVVEQVALMLGRRPEEIDPGSAL